MMPPPHPPTPFTRAPSPLTPPNPPTPDSPGPQAFDAVLEYCLAHCGLLSQPLHRTVGFQPYLTTFTTMGSLRTASRLHLELRPLRRLWRRLTCPPSHKRLQLSRVSRAAATDSPAPSLPAQACAPCRRAPVRRRLLYPGFVCTCAAVAALNSALATSRTSSGLLCPPRAPSSAKWPTQFLT
jgi:hypothetical protein